MGALQEIFSWWSTTSVATMLTDDDLFEEAPCGLGSNKACGGILTFVTTTDHPQGVARVLHNIRECRGHGLHHRVVFAHVGDVQEFNIDVVCFAQQPVSLSRA